MNGVIVASPIGGEPYFPDVMLTPQDTWTETSHDVLIGHERVSLAIIKAWLDDNPLDVSIEVEGWISTNHQQDVVDRNWDKRWQKELAELPAIVEALKKGQDELFERAGLTKFQAMAMRKTAAGKTPKDIAFSTGCTADAASSRIQDARKKILSLGRAEKEVS